jgi:hypothetical protein
MRRIMMVVTVTLVVVAMMVAMSMPAFADANQDNAHTCTGVYISSFAPDALEGGQEGDNASGAAKSGERGDNLTSFNEGAANCGNNR